MFFSECVKWFSPLLVLHPKALAGACTGWPTPCRAWSTPASGKVKQNTRTSPQGLDPYREDAQRRELALIFCAGCLRMERRAWSTASSMLDRIVRTARRSTLLTRRFRPRLPYHKEGARCAESSALPVQPEAAAASSAVPRTSCAAHAPACGRHYCRAAAKAACSACTH